jgi:molecular chaperone GrpE
LDEHDSTPTEEAATAGPTSEEHGLESVPSDTEEEADLATADRSPSEVEALRYELEQVQDLLRRKQAEFDNYRKRIDREQKEFVAYAAAELVLDILPVLDNLERALESSEGSSPDQIREGVEIIYRQFHEKLKKAGLREVDALGEDFDPHVHEAVARVDSADHREGEVLEVLQKGYFLRDRLLRPAMVKVGHNPALGDSDEESESAGEVGVTDHGNNSDA